MRNVTSDDAVATFMLGGDLPVRRLGFGAMRITGAGIPSAAHASNDIRVELKPPRVRP
jgi:hypothetical protein